METRMILKVAGIELNRTDRTNRPKLNGKVIGLRPMEFRLLELLMRVSPKVAHAEWLYIKLWETQPNDPRMSLAVLVRNLRNRVGRKTIQNERGVGYWIGGAK